MLGEQTSSAASKKGMVLGAAWDMVNCNFVVVIRKAEVAKSNEY